MGVKEINVIMNWPSPRDITRRSYVLMKVGRGFRFPCQNEEEGGRQINRELLDFATWREIWVD